MVTSDGGMVGLDRSNLSTVPFVWNYAPSGMRGLASKSRTTWFLGGSSALNFYKFHFELTGTTQLTYSTDSGNFG
jgi:hypothetical protein